MKHFKILIVSIFVSKYKTILFKPVHQIFDRLLIIIFLGILYLITLIFYLK